MSMNYKEIAKGISSADAEKYSQGIALMGNFADVLRKQGLLPSRFTKPEVSDKAITFTDEERKVLKDDGAFIYLPTGETIKGQKSDGRPFWYINEGFKVNGKNRLTEFPSRKIEVAIYPDPERFFVPDSFNKTTDQQIDLVKQDVHSLRERLGLPNINEILPEASEATEVLFKYFKETGIRILGQDYIRNGYWNYIRTCTSTNKEGSYLADVGYWGSDNGLNVYGWYRAGGFVFIGAARWVVPTGTR